MPPPKSTEMKATAKGKAAENIGTSKIVPKKEANNNKKDEPIVKPRSLRETKPAIKMESADDDAEHTADEGVLEPETPKRGPGRTSKYGAAKEGEPSQPSKETGGWVYTGKAGVTAEESRVVGRDEEGNSIFPWASVITMKQGEPIEYHRHNHRTAYLVVSSGRIAIFREGLIVPTTIDPLEKAISGVLDKQSEIFIVPKSIVYHVNLQTNTVKFVEGHEVLDAATRDLWIVSGEIEWDDDVDSHAVGKVTQQVVDEGDVSGRVLLMARWQAEQDRLASGAALEEEQKGVATFKHVGAGASDSQSGGNDGSSSKSKKCSESDDRESPSPDSDAQRMGKDAGTGMEKNESEKSPEKEETPKKKRGTRGRAVRVKK